MKAKLIKQLFSAIANSDEEALYQLKSVVIEEEKKKGHTLLAQELENIQTKDFNKSCQKSQKTFTVSTSKKPQSLIELSNYNPLVKIIPREKLRHHLILQKAIETRFQTIEREYAGRERLAHHGLSYKQKILLYGFPGCGKTLSAERLSWNLGLSLLKINFELFFSFSSLDEILNNLRLIFQQASRQPCLLFFDECNLSQDYPEIDKINRFVNITLELFDEYQVDSVMLVAAINLQQSTNISSISSSRRFDEIIEILNPEEKEIENILRQIFLTSGVEIGSINWGEVTEKMKKFSVAQTVKVAENAAKIAILDREGLLLQEHLISAIKHIK